MTLESAGSWYERNKMDEAQKWRAAFMKLGGLYLSEKITNEKNLIDRHITTVNNELPWFEDEFFRFFGELEWVNSWNVDITKLKELKEFLYSLSYACNNTKPEYQKWWSDAERQKFEGIVGEWSSWVDKLKIKTAFLFRSNQYWLSYPWGTDINSWRSIEESCMKAISVPSLASLATSKSIFWASNLVSGTMLGFGSLTSSALQETAVKFRKLSEAAENGDREALVLLEEFIKKKKFDSNMLRKIDNLYGKEVKIVLSAQDKQEQIGKRAEKIKKRKENFKMFTVDDVLRTINQKEAGGNEDSPILKNIKRELWSLEAKKKNGELTDDLDKYYPAWAGSFVWLDFDKDLASELKEKYWLFSESLRSSIVDYVNGYLEKIERVKTSFDKIQGKSILWLPLSESLFFDWRFAIWGDSQILYKAKLDELLKTPDEVIVNEFYNAYMEKLMDWNLLTEQNVKEIAWEQDSQRVRFDDKDPQGANPLVNYSRIDVIKWVLKKFKNKPTAENLKLIEYFARRAFPSLNYSVDWKWDDVIANYLSCLSNDRWFLDDEEYSLIIKDILSQQGNPDENLSDKYKTLSSIENEIENAYQASAEMLDELWLWNFDTSSPYSIYKVKPQYRKGVVEKYIPQTKEDSDKFNFILHNSKNWKLDKSIISLTDDEIERIIPRKPYLDAVTKFITENDAEAFKKDPLLAEKIMDGFHFDDPDLENLKDNWYEWWNQGIINEYRNNVGWLIKFQSWETALWVREWLFEWYMKEKCGFSIEYLPSNDPEIFRFQDKNNQWIVYRFKPLTWEIFVEREWVLDIWNKSISISWDNAVSLELVANVPPYEVFLNQVVPFDTLPKNRVETYQDLADEIGENISGMMTYSFWTLEASKISDNILWSRYSWKIFQSAKEILWLGDKELLTEEEDKVRYQLLAPIINTVQRSSWEELQEISMFFDKLVVSKKKWVDSQNQRDIFHYFNWDLTFEKGEKVWSRDGTLIWILLSFLEKDYWLDNGINRKATWNFEDRVLDIERIKYLNWKTENDNESSQRFNQWYNDLDTSLSKCYNKEKEILAQVDLELDIQITKKNLDEAYW